MAPVIKEHAMTAAAKTKTSAKKIETGAYRLPEGCCRYCDVHRLDTMMPPHTPSKNCESGKRAHCTCDVCF